MTSDEKPSVAGLVACLAALEAEALALGRPLAAHLIATASAALVEEGRISFTEDKEPKRHRPFARR